MHDIIFGLIIGGITNAKPICKNQGMHGGKDGPCYRSEIPGRATCPIGIAKIMGGGEGQCKSVIGQQMGGMRKRMAA